MATEPAGWPQDPLEHGGDHGGPLTIGRLLHERLLRAAAETTDEVAAARPVSWCLPWDQALAASEQLDGILVYASSGQVNVAGLNLIAARGAAGAVLAGAAAAPADPQADSAGLAPRLPLLRVGAEVTFRELSRLVAELSLARETHVLRYGLDVHHSLVELLYRGAGLSGLCYQMARLAGTAATILDSQYRVLAFERSRERELDQGAVAAALRQVLSPPADLDRPHGARLVTASCDGQPLTCVTSSIVLAGRHDGWVAVVESAEPPHPHDLAQHRVVAEQAATIVGTEMLRMRSIEQAKERARGDFVHALLHGRFAAASELEARAAHYGFRVDASYGVIVARRLSDSGETEAVTTLLSYARAATRLAPAEGTVTMATVVGDMLAVVRQVDVAKHANPDAADRALGEYAAALRKDLTRRTGRSVPVAWGRAAPDAARIYDSYREARLALELLTRLGMPGPSGFSGLRVFATLAELAGNEKAQAFARDMLAPLRNQRAGVADLEESVITYIKSGGNLNAAARELRIHRNTMLYKLGRASRALDLDLRQAEHQFAVWLAYKLDLLFETTRAVNHDVAPQLHDRPPAALTQRLAYREPPMPVHVSHGPPEISLLITLYP